MLVSSKLSREEKRVCSELYKDYRRFLYSVAKSCASSEMPAEDIVQNATFAMAKHSETLRAMGERARLTYLRYIVQNEANDHYRRAKRTRRLQFQVETLGTCCSRSAEADYMEHANSELLEQVLNSMDERENILLRGKYYLRLKDEEIAEIVGCKPDSVRTLVMRAKRKAQNLLIKEGFNRDEI